MRVFCVLVHTTGQGAVVGVTDFVLKRLRSFQGVASTDVTVVEIGREALEVMVTEVPEVATAMQVGRACAT
jgi:CRP-like cAMP-binding protein